jgi:hypothetical protein
LIDMQIPDREPGPAADAAISVLRKNLDNVQGAAAKAIEAATGWSFAEASKYYLDHMLWLKGAAAILLLCDITGWPLTEMSAYLLANQDHLEETAKQMPGAVQIPDVTLSEAVRLAAMRAKLLSGVDADDTTSE